MSLLEGVLAELAALESTMSSVEAPEVSGVVGAESGIFEGEPKAQPFVEEQEVEDPGDWPGADLPVSDTLPDVPPVMDESDDPDVDQDADLGSAPPKAPSLSPVPEVVTAMESEPTPVSRAADTTMKSEPVPSDVQEAGDRRMFIEKFRTGLPGALILAGEALDHAAEAVRKARAAIDILTRLFVSRRS